MLDPGERYHVLGSPAGSPGPFMPSTLPHLRYAQGLYPLPLPRDSTCGGPLNLAPTPQLLLT